MFATSLTVLALAAAAAAQTTIQVGAEATTQGGIFQYIPNTVTAKNGTVITFVFSGAPGNHSVTQSTFADPCTPAPGGFDSGWILLPDAPATPPMWNLTITDDSKPIWFFCKQLLPMPHCAAGMVGAINAPTSGPNTLAAFEAAAAKFQGPSGQSVGGLVGIGASASAGIGPVPTDGMIFGTPTGAGSAAGSSPTATSPAGTGATTGASSTGGAAPTTGAGTGTTGAAGAGSGTTTAAAGGATTSAPASSAMSVAAGSVGMLVAVAAGLFLA